MKRLSYAAALAAGCLLLQVAGCGGAEAPKPETGSVRYTQESTPYDARIKSAYEPVKVAQTAALELYVDPYSTDVKVVDKRSGRSWYSNPPDRGGLGVNLVEINSHIELEYAINDNPLRYSTAEDAIPASQFSFSEIPNGVRVNYLFGEKPEVYTVPQVLSVERYERFLSRLDEAGRESLSMYYKYIDLKAIEDKESQVLYSDKFPALRYRPCYVTNLRSATDANDPTKPPASPYIMEKLQTLFEQAGYTAEDLRRDNEENEMPDTINKDLSIYASVEYRLDGDAFTATIPRDSLAYNADEMELTKVTLLPAFGAAGRDASGYIFVPDGPGALIRLNNGKPQTSSFSGRIYGSDKTLGGSGEETAAGQDGVYLPVFGIQAGETAFLAIVEQGDAIGQIEASVSNATNPYNQARAVFNVNASETQKTLSVNANYNRLYQEELARTDMRVRYRFLYGDNASYTGMARDYQAYLLERGLLKKQPAGEAIPLFVDVIQAVEKKKLILGVPVDRPLSLTTYRQTGELLEKLSGAGVGSVRMKLSGWCNGGVFHTAFTGVDLISALGGRQEFQTLADTARRVGAQLYPDCEFLYVPRHSGLGGYRADSQASRTLENVAAVNALRDPRPDWEPRRQDWSVVSPASYSGFVDRFLTSYEKLPLDGLATGWMGVDLNGDYRAGALVDRAAAKELTAAALAKLAGRDYRVAVQGGNVYTVANASLLYNLPTQSSRYYVSDATVPFYQIVLHGYVPYAAEPLNFSADWQEAVLRVIETGSLPAFTWIYEDNTALKDTSYSYYAVSYPFWFDRAAALYKEVNEALGDCRDAVILDHRMLREGLYRIRYEGGRTVYVNYGETALQADGHTIGPRDYLSVKGE